MVWPLVAAAAVTAAASMYSANQANAAQAKQAGMANSATAAMQQASFEQQAAMYEDEKGFSREMFARQSEFQMAQDQRARDYYDSLSNTAYQRAMADMKTAGLNPLLAYQQGGASSAPVAGSGTSGSVPGVPGAAMGSGQQAHVGQVLGPAVSAAFQAAQTVTGLEQMEQAMSQSRAQEKLLEAQSRQTEVNTGLQVAQTGTEEERQRLTAEMQRTERARQHQLGAQAGLASAQTGTEAYRRDLVGQQAATEREETGRRSAERQRSDLELRNLENWGASRPGAVANTAEAVWNRLRSWDGRTNNPVNEMVEGVLRWLR